MKTFKRSALAAILCVTTAVTALPAAAGGAYSYSGHHVRDAGRHGGGEYYRHHGRHHGDDGVALGAGLIFGLLLGSAIESSYERRYQEPAYYGPPPGYRPVPQAVYSEPPITVAERPAGACLQEREYQTKVIVNGRKVDAYGVACLQPDGSWHQGPARLVPDF